MRATQFNGDLEIDRSPNHSPMKIKDQNEEDSVTLPVSLEKVDSQRTQKTQAHQETPLGDRNAESSILVKDTPLIPKELKMESMDKRVQIETGPLSMEYYPPRRKTPATNSQLKYNYHVREGKGGKVLLPAGGPGGVFGPKGSVALKDGRSMSTQRASTRNGQRLPMAALRFDPVQMQLTSVNNRSIESSGNNSAI